MCLAVCCAVQNDLQQMRAAYDAFLAQYPLCYGYWKKYAEAERRQGSSSGDADGAGSGAAATAAAGSRAAAQQAAAAVYQRGVAAVPHSTELWVAYAALLQASDAPTDTVRRWAAAARQQCVLPCALVSALAVGTAHSTARHVWMLHMIRWLPLQQHCAHDSPTDSYVPTQCQLLHFLCAHTPGCPTVSMRPPLLLLGATTPPASCGTSS